MDSIEQSLRAYENDKNVEQNIRNAITGAYKNLKPELTTINTYENQQFPEFYNQLQTGYGAGVGAQDLDPTARLQNAWGEVGRLSTNANVARGVLDVRRAGMEDLIAAALKRWELGYSMKQSAWDRAYKQAQLARMGSGSGGGGIILPKIKQKPAQVSNGVGLIVDNNSGNVVGYSNGYSSNYLPGANPFAGYQSSGSLSSTALNNSSRGEPIGMKADGSYIYR